MDDTESATTANLVLYNAKVITLNPAQPYAEIVAIKGNRILAVGNKDDLGFFKKPGTRLIDCEGGSVIPGFNDAHCHPLSLAVNLLSLDCSSAKVTNISQIQDRIRCRAEQSKEGQWIRAVNYDEFHLNEKRPPHRFELDQASPHHPVILVHRTAGTCVLNSLALQLAGITGNTPDSLAESILKDPETGKPNGLISGRNEQVERTIPPLTDDELEQGMKLVNQEYLSQGITSVQDTNWNNGSRHWQMWQRLMDRGVVSFRVSLFLGTESLEKSGSLDLPMGKGDDRLRISGIKIALDESTGCQHPPQEDLNQIALTAFNARFRLAFHVSDIPMLEASLAAIKFVCQGVPAAENRFRLEHCAICPPGLLLKVKTSKAIVVAQPSFLYYLGQKYQEEVLPNQTNWFQPIGSFNRWGVAVAFSSDSPLVTCNPFRGIYAAVTRKTEGGQKLAPQESISILEALKMYTLGGAYASFEDGVKGSISPGKLADLAVLNRDLTRLDHEQLPDLKVIQCIANGKLTQD